MITRNKNRSCNWGNLQFIFYLLSVCLFTGVSASYSQITLSEIMYDPIGNENYDEFIEIYNLSPTESIELRGWLISDGTGIDAIKDAGQGTVLAPGQFGLILDPQYFSNSTSYNSVIPPEALVLTIDNNTLGSGGLSNSTAETISLINPAGQTVASYTYSLGNAPGHSDEKIVLAGPDIPDNWADSRVLLGTPGFKNSVTPVELNLAVTAENISFSPARPGPGDEVTITAWIHNSGTDSTGNFQVYFYEDIDEDSLPEVGEDLGPPVTVSQVLAPKDSVIVSMVWSNVKSGFHQILVQLVLSGDADTSNNRAVKALPVSFPPRSLIINEIMYRPASGEAEWVEFYNPNEQAINLRGWGLTDSRPQARVVITNKSAEVKPGEFVIVAEDSTIFNSFPEISCLVFIPPKGFPALNNNYDSVVLSDLTGLAVDSLAYRASWGGELGVSLERIRYHGPSNDAKNWASSRDSSGGTPGRKNSVCPLEFDLSVTPKGFTFIPSIPNAGEAVRLSVIIHNLGSQAASHFQVRFFDDTNLDSLPDLDEEIGRTLPLFDDDTLILVVSDHGAKAMHGAICVNEWLQQNGYLALKEKPAGRTRFKMDLVDWSRTRAWGEGGYYSRIFFNVKGREPQGQIPAGEYEDFREEIKARLEAITDEKGVNIGTRVFKPEEIYRRTERIPPDLIVYFGQLNWRAAGVVGTGSIHMFENDTGPDDANHAEDGIIISNRRLHPAAGSPPFSIYDIDPTVLAASGIPAPPEMIGRNLLSA
ncbi:MAG: lamin tail domain-containing protein [candidate division KSB1 bacterium]|nr:lamin tail domain-containing protein [candidate division KSB1 bacterium]